MQSGSYVHLHTISADGSVPDHYVDALILSIYPEQPGWPAGLIDVAYYNPQKRGNGILDKIDFRLGVKHENHEDIAKGKELYYWTYPAADVPPVPAEQPILAPPTLTDAQVFLHVYTQVYAGVPLTEPEGATLKQFIDAVNRIVKEEVTAQQPVQQAQQVASEIAPAGTVYVSSEGATVGVSDGQAIMPTDPTSMDAVDAAQRAAAEMPSSADLDAAAAEQQAANATTAPEVIHVPGPTTDVLDNGETVQLHEGPDGMMEADHQPEAVQQPVAEAVAQA